MKKCDGNGSCGLKWGCEICNPSPKLEDLTCYNCPSRDNCPCVDDYYNINGDCLMEK